MAILNQEIKMNDPLVFRLVAYRYRNRFYGQWVIHLAIFDFSLACEMLQGLPHHPLRSPRTICTTVQKRFTPSLSLIELPP